MKRDKNHHHIYPKSRFPKLKAHPKNVSLIDIDAHALYHLLFKNRSPEEVIIYLNEYFWNDSFKVELFRKW